MLMGWQCLKMECHSGRVNTLKLNYVFFSINVGNCTFLIVFASILCVWVRTSAFNYLRCKATINYKSLTLPHKTVLWYSVCLCAFNGRTFRPSQKRNNISREVCCNRVSGLLCAFLKRSSCPTKCHRCALSQSDKYVKTSFVYLNRLIV